MAEKKKQKPKGDGEDESTLQLQKVYKKKCEIINGIPLNKLLKGKVDTKVADEEHIDSLHLWEEMGPVGVRALADTCSEINYQHLKNLRLWKVGAGDEGVRAICNYMLKCKTIEYLDLLDNQIGLLGCEFLSNVLAPSSEVPLKRLKIDHNPFGTEGLAILSQGLSQNNTLEKLSMCHCNIDTEGANYFQQLLGNVDSQLIKLKIQGNVLKNEGIYQLFRVFKINQFLEKVNLADNQAYFKLPEDEKHKSEDKDKPNIKLVELMVDVLKTNQNIIYYDFRFNGMTEEVGQEIISCIEANKSLYRVECSDHLPQLILEKIKLLTKKRKPKKKKKGKGKKKKK